MSVSGRFNHLASRNAVIAAIWNAFMRVTDVFPLTREIYELSAQYYSA